MNEKELKEMMVSDDKDENDVEMKIKELKDENDVEMKIKELKDEIDRMIKEIKEISPEEKVIMKKIQQVLGEHEIKYSYDEDVPKQVGLGFSIDNKPLELNIILQNGKVIFKLSFPFRVQSNAFPLMCMFMSGFNKYKAFSLLHVDPDDGELSMEYSYILEDPEQFNEKCFLVYMKSLIDPALEIYTKVAHISVGMVTGKDRNLYKKLLEMALETINGDFDDDNVHYGTELLKSRFIPDLSDIFGKDDGDEVKEDNFDPNGEDITSDIDIMHSLRRRGKVLSFDEFMGMKMQAEESGEVETKDQTEKTDGVLSMFAKKDEEKNQNVIGEDEDE